MSWDPRAKARHPRPITTAVIAAALLVGGCVLDDLTGPAETFGDLALVGDSVLVVGVTRDLELAVTERTGLGPLRVKWSSSDSSVVTVSDGSVTALRAGDATVSARLTGPDLIQPVERSVELEVVWAGMFLEPVDSFTAIGETRVITAFGLDVSGTPTEPVAATYTSSNPDVIEVEAGGGIVARGEGTATLTATLDTFSVATPVRVRQVAAAVIFASPELVFTTLGRDTIVPMEARDPNGVRIPGVRGRWSSSDSAVVRIVSPGVVRPMIRASATIIIEIDTIVAELPTVVEQSASSLTVSAGSGSTAQVATAVATTPAVQVTDGGGNPVPGRTVTFSLLAGGGVLTDSVATSDAAGVARLGGWTLGTTTGVNAVRATAGSLTVDFTATATPGPISAQSSVVSVQVDTVVSGEQILLTLEGRDVFGNPLDSGGASVTFAISGGTSDGAIGPTSDSGDGTYSATFQGTNAGTESSISATVDGTPVAGASIPVTVVPSATAASIAIDSGNGQTAEVGTAVAVAPRVVARDGSANPVANAVVVFSIASGGGTLVDSVVSTDENGIARPGSWILGPAVGGNALNATSGIESLSFIATAVAGPGDAAMSVLSTTAGTVAAGAGVTLTVTARDRFGNPTTTGGQEVAFSASGGTSTGFFGATVDAGDGSYSSPFTGAQAGSETTISATLDGNPLPSTIAVRVDPGPATQILSISGDEQMGAVDTEVPIRPTVEVRDDFNNPVGGQSVDFSVLTGGGSLTGATVVTAADGRAQVGSWTLGTELGENGLRAEAAGLTVDFLATATPGPASAATSQIVVTSDTVVAGEQVTLSLVARDEFGFFVTVGGEVVSFAVGGGGSAGTVGPVVDAGDGSYSATFQGTTSGSPSTVSATVGGVPVTTPEPSLVVVPSAVAASLSVDAGDGQTAFAGTSVPTAPRVIARDGASNPVADVVVTFSVTAGSGVIQDSVVATDANGVATLGSWILGTTPGPNTLSAVAGPVSVSFGATGTVGAGSASTSVLTVPADTLVAGDSITLAVSVRDPFGNPVESGGQDVAFSVAPGGSSGNIGPTVDGGDGTYTASFKATQAGAAAAILATLDGDTLSASSELAVLPGVPSVLSVFDGDGQVTDVGTAVPTPPSVRITDAFGNPREGETVAFWVVQGGGSVTAPAAVTDADGRAQVGSWTVGTTPGSNGLRVAVGPLSLDFDATGQVGIASPAQSVVTVTPTVVVAGDPATFTLRTRDVFGNDLSSGGSLVTFEVADGSSQGALGDVVDRGDGTYEAVLEGRTAGTPATVRATLDGNPVTSLLPTIQVVPGVPDTIVVLSGDGQTSVVGTALAASPTFRVEDDWGNPVPGEPVNITVDAGGGSVTGASVTTDPSGEGALGSWTLGTVAGPNRLLVVSGSASSRIFATGRPGPSSLTGSLLTSSSTSVLVAELITITLTVRDQYGNPVGRGGQLVSFDALGGIGVGIGLLGPVTDHDDGTYSATFLGVSVGAPIEISATLDGGLIADVVQILVELP